MFYKLAPRTCSSEDHADDQARCAECGCCPCFCYCLSRHEEFPDDQAGAERFDRDGR